MPGNYKTKREAESKAKQMRKQYPRHKPVRVKKAAGGGYDVYTK